MNSFAVIRKKTQSFSAALELFFLSETEDLVSREREGACQGGGANEWAWTLGEDAYSGRH
jgi:hypothetical protein